MTRKQIEGILKKHSVPYYIQNDRIYADNMESFTEPFDSVTDVTDYTKEELKHWLGY